MLNKMGEGVSDVEGNLARVQTYFTELFLGIDTTRE